MKVLIILETSTGEMITDKEVSNALVDCYNNASNLNLDHEDKPIKCKLTSVIQNMKQQQNGPDMFSKTSSPNELDQAISNIKPGKADGKDYVCGNFLKNLGPIAKERRL